MQDLYAESYKMLLRKIKKKNKWRDIPCSWIGRLNILKMAILSELIQHNPYQIPMTFIFAENKLISRFIWKCKDSK